jgi:LysR family nitrogen assimilation transcriptional regulator
MTLRQLAYFLKVVETGSMTRAAERLNVAQPALGVQIRQLEEELGVALLLRHAWGIETTTAGALLAERAREIVGLVERARRDVAASGHATAEPVRLGLTPSLMHIVGTEIALLARERTPLAALSLSEEMSHKLVEALQRGTSTWRSPTRCRICPASPAGRSIRRTWCWSGHPARRTGSR